MSVNRGGSGLSMPHRRTFASGILPSLTRCCLRFAIHDFADQSACGGSVPEQRRRRGHGQPLAAASVSGAMDAGSAIGCSPRGRAHEKARRGHGCLQRYRLLAWRASAQKKPAGAMDGPAGVKGRRGESNPCPVMFQRERLRVCPVDLDLAHASPADRVRHGPARNFFSPGRTRR